MDLREKISYLGDLVNLMAFHEDLGATTSNRWIVKEFQSVNAEVLAELKDKHDEAKQRNEAGADLEGDRSRGGVTDRDDAGDAA